MVLTLIRAASEAPTVPRIVRLLRLSPPDTLDPTYVNTSFGYMLMRVLYRTLVTQPIDATSDGWEPVLDLAEHVSVSEDGLLYSFQIRSGLKYSDGRYIGTGDFRAGLERALTSCASNRSSPSAMLLLPIAGAEELMHGEERSLTGVTERRGAVQIRLVAPTPDFLHRLTLPVAAPLQADVAGNQPAAFTGPYKVSTSFPTMRSDDVALRLSRNCFWQSSGDPIRTQGVDSIDVVIHQGDLGTAVQAVVLGQADCLGLATPSHLAEARAVLDSGGGRLHTSPTNRVFFLSIRSDRTPFRRADVRRSLATYLDKDRILAAMGGAGAGDVADHMIPPGLGQQYAVDRSDQRATSAQFDAARNLLTESWAECGRTISLITSTAPPDCAAGQIIAASLVSLGLRVSLEAVSFDSLYRLLESDTAGPDLALAGWLCEYPDPVTLFPPLFSSGGAVGNRTNYSRLHDSGMDKLISQATNCADSDRRTTLWKRVNSRALELAPIIPLVWPRAAHLVSERLERYSFSPMSASPDLARVAIRAGS